VNAWAEANICKRRIERTRQGKNAGVDLTIFSPNRSILADLQKLLSEQP
jgi:hypothetical protein